MSSKFTHAIILKIAWDNTWRFYKLFLLQELCFQRGSEWIGEKWDWYPTSILTQLLGCKAGDKDSTTSCQCSRAVTLTFQGTVSSPVTLIQRRLCDLTTSDTQSVLVFICSHHSTHLLMHARCCAGCSTSFTKSAPLWSNLLLLFEDFHRLNFCDNCTIGHPWIFEICG